MDSERALEAVTVYISIGNSDDKLTQQLWAAFYRSVNTQVRRHASAVHGQWVSEPASAWQNACWCIEVHSWQRGLLRGALQECARIYGQDSIAWAEVALTEFLPPSEQP